MENKEGPSMTEIRIRRLVLDNFKCHKHLELDFAGGNASIYGDNASGKTSIYDALTWLLFGKDSAGNGEKNMEIKPLDVSGEVKDHLAVTSVEAVLDVNGEEVTLRRTYREVWATRRGASEPAFDGNTSEYYVDGVPCRKNAFCARVNALVEEDIFRLLTSVSYFAGGLSWQDRRAVLFRVAGVLDDGRILASDERFKPLREAMGRLSPEDYRKKLLSEKRKFIGAKTEIPARISECQKTLEELQGLDFAGAGAEAERLTAQKESIAARIAAIEQNSAAAAKRGELREAELEQSELEREKQAYRARQAAAAEHAERLNTRLATLQSRLAAKRRSLETESEYLAQLDARIAASRNEWIAVNAEVFTASDCPTCAQPLPPEQLRAAKERFAADKQKRLDRILQDSNASRDAKAMAESRFCRAQEEGAQLEAELAGIREQIAAAEKVPAEPVDMDGFAARSAAVSAKLRRLSGELADLTADGSGEKETLRRRLDEVNAKLADCAAVTGKEVLRDYARERMAALRQDAKAAAARLNGIERMLSLLDEYTRYKTRFVESSVNGLFRLARFRLFREQANGGVEDRCDVVYGGVPYLSLNNGMRINLGIDMINTLSAAYGVRVPLFVDNAESVTKLERSGSQVIRLVVSEADRTLRVRYEKEAQDL